VQNLNRAFEFDELAGIPHAATTETP